MGTGALLISTAAMVLAAIPFHPPIAHLPIGLAFLLPVFTLSIAFSITRTWLPRAAWLLVVMVSALATGTALFAKETGEDEERRLNDPSLQAAIHEHEDAAEWLVISSVALTLLAIGVSFVKNAKAFSAASFAVGVLMFWPMSTAMVTGHHGGVLVFNHGAGQMKAGLPSP